MSTGETGRDIPIHCGWCGAELEEIGENHSCERGARVFAALASRDIGVLLDD